MGTKTLIFIIILSGIILYGFGLGIYNWVKRGRKIKEVLITIIVLFAVSIIPLYFVIISKDKIINSQIIQENNSEITTNTSNEVKTKVVDNNKKIIYIEEAKKINKDVVDSFNYLAQLLADKPLSMYWNETELITATLSTAYLEQAHDKAIELNPSDDLKKMHDKFLSALLKFKQAMPLFRQGLDNLDSKKINQSTILMTEGASLIRQATAMMK